MTSYLEEELGYVLEDWCHPDGDDAHLYCTDEEYQQSAEDYLKRILIDSSLFEEEWGEVIRENLGYAKEKFPGLTIEERYVKSILLRCLKSHINC
jgi:hypothetical protein